jgi:hypothetical protein
MPRMGRENNWLRIARETVKSTVAGLSQAAAGGGPHVA